jgi:hypothetical protein
MRHNLTILFIIKLKSMTRITILIFLLLLNIVCYCQITKKNWMVGGNASYSSYKHSSTATVQYEQNIIQVSPAIGYFLIDKLAVGLRPSISHQKQDFDNTTYTHISIGPFIRQYFLQPDNRINLFAEAGYSYGQFTGRDQPEKRKSNTIALSGGPVFYFNSSVGLEMFLSYTSKKFTGSPGRNNELVFGLGFQIHLEKDY